MFSLKDIIGYFNPSRSPHYLIIIFTVFGLLNIGDLDTENSTWYLGAIILCFTLVLTYILALRQKVNEENNEEYNKEMKFARSIALIGGICCIAFFFNDLFTDLRLLYVVLIAALIQILVFGAYLVMTQNKNEQPTSINMLQLCLITTSLLVGISYSGSYEIKNSKEFTNARNYDSLNAMLKKAQTFIELSDSKSKDNTSFGYPLADKSDSVKYYQKKISEITNNAFFSKFNRDNKTEPQFLFAFSIRYMHLRYFFTILWGLLIIRWLYHLAKLKKKPE
jgi:hypothetical protein